MKPAAISWLATIGIGFATAIVAMLVSGWFASKAVSWYEVPVREGAQGYFVLFQAIFGFIGGLVIGIVATRMLSDTSFVRALITAQTAVLVLICSIAGIARLLAHVPPKIDGEELMLALEFSWPASKLPTFGGEGSTPHVTLYSTAADGPAYGKQGPLWNDKTRRESDRVIVPAVVEVYTSRGQRLLQVHVNNDSTDVSEVITVPLRGYPNKSDMNWSEWKPASTSSADAPSYRFRVAKRNETVRTDTVGPFTIEMVAESFELQSYNYREPNIVAKSRFVVRYNNEPVPTFLQRAPGSKVVFNQGGENFKTISAVGGIAGNPNALVLHVDELYSPGQYCLLHIVNDKPVCQYMGTGAYRIFAHEMHPALDKGDSLTTRVLWGLDGNFRRNAMINTSLYVFPECVLDARTLKVYEIPRENTTNDLNEIAPVGLSPDLKKFARVVGDSRKPVLAVITLSDGARRELSTQNSPSPSGNWTDADRAWFDNYFTWKADANGEYQVEPSPLAIAMPRRGRLKQEPDYRQYDVSPVDSTMRDVIVEFLVKEMGAVRVSVNPDDYSHTVTIGGEKMYVSMGDALVSVTMDRGQNTLPVATFARKFDQVLATRRHDKLFLKELPN